MLTETKQKDLETENKSFQKIIEESQEKIGSILLHKGQKIFEVSSDLFIQEAVYDTVILDNNLENKRKKLTFKKDKIYIVALNYANAYKKLMKKLNNQK